MAMAQYMSNYLFDKYEDEEMFSAYQYGLPISISMNPESVAAVVDDANITMTSLIII